MYLSLSIKVFEFDFEFFFFLFSSRPDITVTVDRGAKHHVTYLHWA